MGSQYVSASKELRRVFKEVNYNKVAAATEKQGVQWHFSTPLSPWENGCSEAMVRLTKKVLKAQLRSARLTFDQLDVLMQQAAGAINARPLAAPSQSFDSCSWVTPAELALGKKLRTLPACTSAPGRIVSPSNFVQKQRRRHQILRHFIKKWKNEYLRHLAVERRWLSVDSQQQRVIKVGDVVHVHDDGKGKDDFQLARVEETYPGTDGVIRSVRLRFPNPSGGKPKFLDRSTRRLSYLEGDDGSC